MNYHMKELAEESLGNNQNLEARYAEIRENAERDSCRVASLRKRARGYLNVYNASNGACRFALIAAHGALWAAWYLICAKLAAVVFAVFDFSKGYSPIKRYRQFSSYVTALKNINKLVMLESYVLVFTVRDLGAEFAATKGIPLDLARDYEKAISGQVTNESFLRDLYHRHFLWEQERVVSNKLDDAFAEFTWPFMRNLCQKPWVWFSYFRAGKSMNFKKFTDQEERVEKGLIAYDRAVSYGVDKIAKISDIRLKILPGL